MMNFTSLNNRRKSEKDLELGVDDLDFINSSFSDRTPLNKDFNDDARSDFSSGANLIQTPERVNSGGRSIQTIVGSWFERVKKWFGSSISWLIFASIVTVLIWQLPSDVGRYIAYPFTIFGTFWHEMGHATSALLCGNSLKYIIIESNGSGLTVYADYADSRICNAIISVNGPLGPTFFGCLIICLSVLFVKHEIFSRILLGLISVIVFVCTVLLVRKSLFGIIFLPCLAVILLVMSVKANGKILTFSLQFIGVQMAISMYQNILYLFSKMDGKSDTGSVEVLFNGLVPYWMVAIFIIIVNVILILVSFLFVFRQSLKQST